MTLKHCRCPGCHRIVLDERDYCDVCIACGCERKRQEIIDEEAPISDAESIFLDALSEPE